MNNIATRALEQLVKLCKRNLFESVNLANGTNTVLNCNGPCGTLLRNNIMREWRESIITTSEELVFGISTFGISNHHDGLATKDQTSKLKTDIFSKNCLLNYPAILQSLNGKLPFGLAEFGQYNIVEKYESCSLIHFDDETSKQSFSTESLNANRIHMLLHFYANPSKVNQWYHTWQRRRLSWWKKFSFTPWKFTSTSIQSINDHQLVEIQYEFPWGKRTIETIYNYGSEPLQKFSEETEINCQGKDGRKMVYPCLIECVTSVENAAFTYLMDAMTEKKFPDGSPRLVLGLHNRLAPYKVSIAISGANSQLKDLATYLTKELQNKSILVLNLPDNSSTTLEQQFIRYDEMGIPYCIVLNDGTTKNGILGLRNRNTTLKEQLHISHVSKNLENYVSGY